MKITAPDDGLDLNLRRKLERERQQVEQTMREFDRKMARLSRERKQEIYR